MGYLCPSNHWAKACSASIYLGGKGSRPQSNVHMNRMNGTLEAGRSRLNSQSTSNIDESTYSNVFDSFSFGDFGPPQRWVRPCCALRQSVLHIADCRKVPSRNQLKPCILDRVPCSNCYHVPAIPVILVKWHPDYYCCQHVTILHTCPFSAVTVDVTIAINLALVRFSLREPARGPDFSYSPP